MRWFLHQHLFATMLGVSALCHAALALAMTRSDFQPPVLIAPQVGRSSVEARLIQFVDPVPVAAAPAVVQPERVLDADVLEPREVVPLPTPSDPAPLPLDPVALPASVVRPDAVVKTAAPKPAVERSTASSAASQANEGARPDQLPLDVVTNPAPPYPAEALAARREGTVWLRVRIDATGRVSAISLHETSNVPSLDDSALRTVRRWLFHPARRNGVPVPYEFLKPIEFSIRQP